MPLERATASCLEDLLAKIGEWQKKTDKIYLFFCGDQDEATGESWCSDCVKVGNGVHSWKLNMTLIHYYTAEPVVEKVLSSADVDNGVFITCTVGTRDVWKDPQNVFRQHPKLQLKGVPTLMLWGTQQRLGDEDCSKEGLVVMMFEE